MDEDTYRRLFVDLNRTGQLPGVLDYIRHRSDIYEKELRVLLREKPLVTPQDYAMVQVLQGRLSAYADLLRNIPVLAERQPQPAPAAPPRRVNGHVLEE